MTGRDIPWSPVLPDGLTVPNSSIHAVHDDDLADVLEALGLAGAFGRRELRCKFCEVVVDEANLYSIFADSGDIKVVCDKPDCVKALLRYTNQRTTIR